MHECCGEGVDAESGFSLVELLVVIVIIGILSAIAIGAFMNQRKKANDATLQSDLRTASTAIMSWSVNNDIEVFAENTTNGSTIVIEGDNPQNNLSHARWNEVEGFPPIHLSEGTTVEVLMISKISGLWPKTFDNGEFCLAGSSPNSTYNYVPGSGNKSQYDRYLFWDSKAGGVKTIDDLIEKHEAGQDISCVGFVNGYTGI